MDDLDEPTLPPVTLPVPKLDIAPLGPDRIADGTRTKLGAVPPPIPARARLLPPPIPDRARASAAPAPRSKGTMPPPIPAAALVAKPRGTASMAAAPSDHVAVDPLIAPPPPVAHRGESLVIVADIDVPITEEPPVALPPLPRPSQSWLATSTPPVRVDQPRRSVSRALVQQQPPLALDDDETPLPPPAPPADSGDDWPALVAPRPETSAVADLFAPAAPDVEPIAATPAKEIDLFAPTSAPPLQLDELPSPPLHFDEPSTTYFDRPHTTSFNKRHLAAVGTAAVVIAVLAAVIVRSQLSKPAAAKPTIAARVPTPPTVPAPPPVEVATAPTPSAPPPAPAASATIDIPVTSSPSGAIVTLIANGAPRVLGKTPLFASVDPAQTYDVVIALGGHPTSMQHLDPRSMKQVAVAFDGTTPTPIVAAAPAAPAAPGDAAPVAVHHHHHGAERVAAADPVASPPSPPTTSARSWNVAPAAKPIAAEPAGVANGVLMVASKPPCEIVIDGKPTHLETPQRTIALAAGQHAVTLINAKLHINKTIPVSVAAKKPTKLIQDFTH